MFGRQNNRLGARLAQFAVWAAAASLGWSHGAYAKAAITTFDPPNSIDTEPASINAGVITGWYYGGGGNSQHGFVRAVDGTFATFDPPNSDGGTFARSINSNGEITGNSVDSSGAEHGFVRATDGTITTFDVNGAVSTESHSINKRGEVAGFYIDANFQARGFKRSSKGKITTFDPAGSTATLVVSMNNTGEAAGFYLDGSGAGHGFVRAQDGTITTFDPPESIDTNVHSINKDGAIAGNYTDAAFALHGFVRAADGTFTEIDPGCNGSIVDMNDKGRLTGFCGSSVDSFVRMPSGKIKTFGVQDSAGTFATSIDDDGNIVGGYIDSHTNHGFLCSQ